MQPETCLAHSNISFLICRGCVGHQGLLAPLPDVVVEEGSRVAHSPDLFGEGSCSPVPVENQLCRRAQVAAFITASLSFLPSTEALSSGNV